MSFDDDLRRALHAEADRYDPGGDGWTGVRAGVDAAHRRRRRQGGVLGGLAAACVVVAGAIVLLGGGDDGDDVATVADTTVATTATTEATAPTTATTDVPAEDGVFPGIWPFASAEAVARYEDGDDRLEDPVATVEAFARDYLGMLDAAVVGDAEPSPDGEGAVVVEVRPRGEDGEPGPDAGARTLVTVRPYETSDGATVWTVTGAASPNLVVDSPGAGAEVGSPVEVRGEATGYEGTVIAEVRQDGMRSGTHLGQAVGIAGSMGEMGPLHLDVAFRPPSEPAGAVVVANDTGRDGVGTPEATVVRVVFAPGAGDPSVGADDGDCAPAPPEGEPADGEMDVTVFFGCGEAVVGVPRRVPETAGVLRASLEQLLAGPTPEEAAAGLSSFFSDATAGLLRGVTIVDGTAVVDLDGRLATEASGASTSAGSALFLGSLNRTVLQFPTVEAVEYRLDGDCRAFGEWLQSGVCQTFTRDDITERP